MKTLDRTVEVKKGSRKMKFWSCVDFVIIDGGDCSIQEKQSAQRINKYFYDFRILC